MQVDIKPLMEGTPRPHYLCGVGKYTVKGNQHKFSTKVNFTSEDHPSIQDRSAKYLPVPHVNAGDCYFAVWNAAHIVAKINGYNNRTLKGGSFRPLRPIPPDTELDLDVIISENDVIGKEHDSEGKIKADFSLDGKTLMRVRATYWANN